MLKPTPWFDATGRLKRPPPRLLVAEARAFVTTRPQFPDPARTPRGDGHAVLVLPAFLNTDGSTRPLQRFLGACGYRVAGWRLGVNIGPTELALRGIERRLKALRAESGGKVSLVGHSFGGVFARLFASCHPEDVRLVITLCSPFRLPTATNVEIPYRLLSPLHSRDVKRLTAALAEPPPVPTTAIYTRSDGIVAWQSCIDEPAPLHENVELRGTHSTIASNPAALAVIADRLAQPEGEWRAYGEGAR